MVQTVKVAVPATAANLGSGFDVFGLALDLWNTVEITVDSNSGGDFGSLVAGNAGDEEASFVAGSAYLGEVQVSVSGHGADVLPHGRQHLVASTLIDLFARLDFDWHSIKISADNNIPQSGGLGSSASAIIAAAAAALSFTQNKAPVHDQIFELAAELEGHPDNAAPAVYGGATLAYFDHNAAPQAVQLKTDPNIAPVIFVPDYAVQTSVVRKLQPLSVPLKDAIFNLSRSALLVNALRGDLGCLLDATEDRLHQPYRADAMPASINLVKALRDLEIPAVISGAGPTVLALPFTKEQSVMTEMMGLNQPEFSVNDGAPVSWQALNVPISKNGATVEIVA